MQKDSPKLRQTVRAAQSGDEAAFEALLSELEMPVYRLAYHLTGHRQDAEDMTQEVLVKLWRTLPSYRFECPILPYVLGMTHNAVIDWRRREAKRRDNTVSLTYEGDGGEREVLDVADPDENADPARAYARKERIMAVRRAVDELPEDFREVLVLKDMQGMSYEGICRAMSLELGTVKSRLFRARKKLAEILKARNIF